MPLDPFEFRRKVLRAIAAFSLRSYLAGEQFRKQSRKQVFAELASGGKQCFCVGSGPSLDCVDLSQVRNSTVLLLNGAFHRMKEFQGNNNRLFWFAQDVRVIQEMIASVPVELTKILTANKYALIESFRPHFRANQDMFLQPKPTLRDPATTDPDRTNHYSIWPSLFTDLNADSYKWELNRRFHVALRSVGFSAIFFAMHFNFDRVIALGMDLPSGRDHHPHASGCGKSLQGSGFGVVARDRALSQLVAMAKIRDIQLYNASPFAESSIIPKKADIQSALR